MKDISSGLCVQTSSEAHPASYTTDTGVLSWGKARPGRNADHSPSSSAEVKNEKEIYLLSLLALLGHVAGQLYLFNTYIYC
jgi:hypothetical protein